MRSLPKNFDQLAALTLERYKDAPAEPRRRKRIVTEDDDDGFISSAAKFALPLALGATGVYGAGQGWFGQGAQNLAQGRAWGYPGPQAVPNTPLVQGQSSLIQRQVTTPTTPVTPPTVTPPTVTPTTVTPTPAPVTVTPAPVPRTPGQLSMAQPQLLPPSDVNVRLPAQGFPTPPPSGGTTPATSPPIPTPLRLSQ